MPPPLPAAQRALASSSDMKSAVARKMLSRKRSEAYSGHKKKRRMQPAVVPATRPAGPPSSLLPTSTGATGSTPGTVPKHRHEDSEFVSKTLVRLNNIICPRLNPIFVCSSASQSAPVRIRCANGPWYQLCEYRPDQVEGNTFDEIVGFRGPLTHTIKPKGKRSRMDIQSNHLSGLEVINYSGVTKKPLRLRIDVERFQGSTPEVVFLCVVVDYEEIKPPASSVS